MSIHVTVTGNPVYVGRGKVLLTDIETAKKNEWLRRRKIRLQQARQQAKDLAQSVRKKVSCEENICEKNEEENKIEEQNKHTQVQIACLQNEYQKSMSSVGTGHHLACIQKECDALAREKQELRDVIAKARGAIAEERLRAEKCIQKEMSQVPIGRKKMARQIEDLRSALISNLPEVKSSVSQTKKSTTKAQTRHNEEPQEVDCNIRVVSPTKKFAVSNNQRQRPLTRSSLSPPRSVREPVPCRSKKLEPDEEDSFDDDESDDSDVTWPPRSARVTKEPLLPPEPPRVRFYDHSTRVVKISPRPSYSVTRMDPFEEPDMVEAINEEEEAIVRKESLDILARREKMIRGNKALRKERAKREAEKFLKDMREMNKKEKIRTALEHTYPSEIHMSDLRRKELGKKREAEIMKFAPVSGFTAERPIPVSMNKNGNKPKTCYLDGASVEVMPIHPESPKDFRFDSSTDNEDYLEELVNKLKIERAKKQDELEKKFDVKDVFDADIPKWVICEENPKETAGPSGLKVLPVTQDRAVSPVRCETKNKICSCSSRCTCNPIEVRSIPSQKEQEELENIVSLECETSSEGFGGERAEGNEPENISPECVEREVETTTNEQHVSEKQINSQDASMSSGSPRPSSIGAGVECGMVSSKSSSHSDTVESSLTFEGIKVTVKVSEKGKKKNNLLSRDGRPQTTDKDIQTSLEESPVNMNMTWRNQLSNTEGTSSGSTSYMSPPSKLSPAHQTLLRGILNKIGAKNQNPRLHQYIKRVLEMSRKSIDDLPVSSVSEISISSSIFDRTSKRPKSLGEDQKVGKLNASCQANFSWSDDSTTQEEALKFSELAEGYAQRLRGLAGMMERMRILPDCRGSELTEDSSAYLSPPGEVHHSVRLSQSVKAGVYPPKPADDSTHHGTASSASVCQDLPPSHIYPHPSTALRPPPARNTNSRKLAGTGLIEAVAHELSTILEGGESQRPETPQPNAFDPDISSIRGTPQKHEGRDSTGSSLCLLDDRDISSWLGSSSDDYEEVFKSLGIAWALPTVRKTRQSQRRASGSQSSSRSAGRGQYSHSTPLGQSPAKPRSSSSAHNHQQPPLSADSDSLTPPSLSLNIPESVWPKRRGSK